MDWTVYNFECTDAQARKRFMNYFEENHPVSFPDDEESIFEDVFDGSGEQHGADYAWIEEEPYLYLTSLVPVEGLLSITEKYWEQAVVASFDSTTETCREATVYKSRNGEPTEVVTYDGVAELGGADIAWRCAVEHGFRFRAYSAEAPTTVTFAPIMSAFDYIPERTEEEFISDLEEAAGIERTAEAVQFIREDPVRLRNQK